MMNLIGMAASELLLPRRASPPLELRRVLDEATARDLAVMRTLTAGSRSYSMPSAICTCGTKIALAMLMKT